jgi:hypothetical protein
MQGKIMPALDGRFIKHGYSGQMSGKSFGEVAIYRFDLNTNKFKSA